MAHILVVFVFTTCSELRKVLFLAASVCHFLFVYEIFWEPVNGFPPNSHGRRVSSLVQTSLKVKVSRDKNDIFFCPFGSLLAVYVWQKYQQSL